MEEMKKELQKLCKKIRGRTGKGEYPKAMMTEKQMKLKTATINCGGMGKTHKFSEEIKRNYVLDAEEFKNFIKQFNIKAIRKETTSCGDLIIRFNY